MNDGKYYLGLLGTLILVFTLGCTPEPVEGPADLGEKANPDDIELALSKATDGTSVHSSKVNQYVKYEGNYRVDMNGVLKTEEISRELVQIKDNTSSRTYVLNELYQKFSRTGQIEDEKTSEVPLVYNKNVPTVAELKTMASSDPNCGKERQDDEGLSYDCVEYYNFKTFLVDEPVPEAVAARPNCGNVPKCILPSRVIHFDQVKFLKGKIVERKNLRFSVSKTIPVLFPDMGLMPYNYFCSAKLYMASGTSYYVNSCTVLRDLSL